MPTREPVTGLARLTLTITVRRTKTLHTTLYLLTYLHPEPWADPAWRLTQEDGTHYDVHITKDGASCTCADFVWCRDGKDGKGCKHVAGLRSVGLLR